MKRPSTTDIGDKIYFHDEQLIFVNRVREHFRVSYHSHDFLEITYIAEGAGFHYIGDDVQKVRRGELFVIPIGVAHVFRPSSTDVINYPLVVYNCVVSPLLLERIYPFILNQELVEFIRSIPSGSPLRFGSNVESRTLDKLFETLYLEFSYLRDNSLDYLHTLLIQLLITVHRISLYDGTRNSSMLQTGEDYEVFRSLLNDWDQNVHQDVTLHHLAQISGYSERHLHRLFLKHTGQTPRHYRQNRRIEKSLELLQSSHLQINVIAEKVGYKDPDTFSAIFKRIMGSTPSEYRQLQYKNISPAKMNR